jgi:hypothetical protein
MINEAVECTIHDDTSRFDELLYVAARHVLNLNYWNSISIAPSHL